jgi:FAD synthase
VPFVAIIGKGHFCTSCENKMKFPHIDGLKAQIALDVDSAQDYFKH